MGPGWVPVGGCPWVGGWTPGPSVAPTGPRVAAVGAWPAPWTPCGRRAGVAPLGRDTQLRLPAILNNALASYQAVATIITCVMKALITGSGRGNQKLSCALRAPRAMAELPF